MGCVQHGVGTAWDGYNMGWVQHGMGTAWGRYTRRLGKWWMQVVDASGGRKWWRQVVEASGGGERENVDGVTHTACVAKRPLPAPPG